MKPEKFQVWCYDDTGKKIYWDGGAWSEDPKEAKTLFSRLDAESKANELTRRCLPAGELAYVEVKA